MPGLRYDLLLAVAFATSACAEIEFGVPTGGAAAGGAGASGGETLLGGGGGRPPTGEQCLNGVDDDDDGLTDCADDDCGEVSCVDIPPGWLGPVELRTDDSPCEGAFSEGIASLKTAVDAPPATCTCSCAGQLQTCDEADLALYGNAACSNATETVTLDNGGCSIIPNTQGTDSYLLSPDLTGACASSVAATLPPVSFEARRLCGLPTEAAGCDDGSCAPSATCVYMSGNVVCPNGFGTPFMGNAGLVDSRSCSEEGCGCGSPTGGCTFSLELFDGIACVGVVIDSTMSAMCEEFSFAGPTSKSAHYTATPGTPSCPPSGAGTPTGSVSLSEPLTVCCAL